MSSAVAKATQGSLPQLGGRLLWLYRIVWIALAIGALAASALFPFQSTAIPAVITLRLVKSAVLICVASILLYRRQREPVAALLALTFLAWTITSSFDFGTDAKFAQLLDRCRFFLFAQALLLFPDGSWQPRWARPIALATGGVFLIGIGEALHLLPTRIFLPLAIVCVVGGIASLIARFRVSANYLLKQQLKWVGLGLVVGVGFILCARVGSVASNSRTIVTPIFWEALFQLGIITVALGFLISLLRYRLFDAETVISRSAAYATLTIALVATFGGTEAAIENLGQSYLGMNIGSISGAMAAAVAAVLLSPLHGRISEWAENRFQPDLAQLKRQMPELLARLEVSTSARPLATAVLSQINAGIHATQSALIYNGRIVTASGMTIAEARHWTRESMGTECAMEERDPGDPTFPVRLRLDRGAGGPASCLLLGSRPDGTLYGREDLDAVRSIFPAFGQALTTAVAREAINAKIERREKRLRTEIGDLHMRLLAVEGFSIGSGKQLPDNPFLTKHRHV